MLSHSIRRWLAGLGVAGALVASCATPASAAADPFRVNAQDMTVAPDVRDIASVTVSQEIQFEFSDTTFDIDFSGVAAFAVVERLPSPPQGWTCATVEQVLHCTNEVVKTGYLSLGIQATGKHGATPGQVGQLKYTVTTGGFTARTTSTVTMGERLDLQTDPAITVSGAPGSLLSIPANVRNGSEATGRGAVLLTHGNDLLHYEGNFSNCRPSDTEGAACFFDELLEPGKRYRLSTGLPFQLSQDARTGATLRMGSVWFTMDEWLAEDPDYPQGGPPGTGARLRLVEDSAAITRAPQLDPDLTNSHNTISVKVTGNHTADLRVTGVTVSGKKDDVVNVQPSVTNLGPAPLENLDTPLLRVTIPEGTTAVKASFDCQPYTSDDKWDPVGGKWGEPGAKEYACHAIGSREGETIFYRFGLRIDTVIPDASGAVRIRLPGDPNSENDTAKIVINPTDTDDGGTGGSLPITGPPTGLIGGLGALLLAAGLIAYLLTRRRRTRFIA